MQNRQKLLSILAIAVIALWVGDKLVFSPLVESWKSRGKSIADLRKSVASAKAVIARERFTRSRWDNMRTNSLPQEESEAENQVVRAFDDWSQASQIGIGSIKTQLKPKDDSHMTVECRVDAFGSLQTVTSFLYDIEKDAMAVKVEDIELTSRESDGRQINLGLQVSVLLLKTAQK